MRRSVRRVATKIYEASTHRGSKSRRFIVSVLFWFLINISLTLAGIFDALHAPSILPEQLSGLRPSKPKLQGTWRFKCLAGYQVAVST